MSIDDAARYLAKTVSQKTWEGLRKDGRAIGEGFRPFFYENARQENYRDVVREIVRLACPTTTDSTCYIERSKVREIICDLDYDSAAEVLQVVDALPIFTAGDFRADCTNCDCPEHARCPPEVQP